MYGRERGEELERLAATIHAETRQVGEDRKGELKAMSTAMEDQVTAVLALAQDADARLGRRLAELERQLEAARVDFDEIVAAQRGELRGMAGRSTEEFDDALSRRAEALERLVADRMAGIELAVDEARRSLEAVRADMAAELTQVARRGGAEMEDLVRRMREVEDSVAQRLGDLEARAVESGAALEELLARMGDVARASTVLNRGTGGGGQPAPGGARDRNPGGQPPRAGPRR